jgi:hypothetical protein
MSKQQGFNISVFEIQRSFVSCMKSLHLDLCARCSGIDSDTIRCVMPAGITPFQGNILLQYAQQGKRNGLGVLSAIKCIYLRSDTFHLRCGMKYRFIIGRCPFLKICSNKTCSQIRQSFFLAA